MEFKLLLEELKNKLSENLIKNEDNILYFFEENNGKFKRSNIIHNITYKNNVNFSFYNLLSQKGQETTNVPLQEFEKKYINNSQKFYGIPFEIYIEPEITNKIFFITKKKRLYSKYIYEINNDLYLSFYNSYSVINLREINIENIIPNNEIFIEELPFINNKIKTYSIDLKQRYFLMGIETKEIFDFEDNGKFLCQYNDKNYYIISNLNNAKEISINNLLKIQENNI